MAKFKKFKKKKSLYRMTFYIPETGERETSYKNSASFFRNEAPRRYSKFGVTSTLSRLSKKTNKFRKVKKIGW